MEKSGFPTVPDSASTCCRRSNFTGMGLSASGRTDLLNIGLMLLSCAVAIVIPLELFLFSYAVLGPLHYLTEISWLHDRGYFTKGRYDASLLLVIALVGSLAYYSINGFFELEFDQNFGVWLSYIGLLSAAIFALVRNIYVRIAGIILIIVTSQLSEHFLLFFGVFLPTLIHVYVFTALFMLYGALKSGSRIGLISVVVMALCPVLLFTLFPHFQPLGMTDRGVRMYIGDHGEGFIGLNISSLSKTLGLQPREGENPALFWMNQVFKSQAGVMLLRFIAFAYTYHYLNWFSKTRVIQWHKVPRSRFLGVLAFWVISLAIYLYDYRLGFMWLFFLSYLHVLLELPLNFTSAAGIVKYCYQRLTGSPKPAPQQLNS